MVRDVHACMCVPALPGVNIHSNCRLIVAAVTPFKRVHLFNWGYKDVSRSIKGRDEEKKNRQREKSEKRSKDYPGTYLLLFCFMIRPDLIYGTEVQWQSKETRDRAGRNGFLTLQMGGWGRNQLFFCIEDICKQGNLGHLLVSQVSTFSLPMSRRERNWEREPVIWMFADCSLSTVATNVIPCTQRVLWFRGCCAGGIPALLALLWGPRSLGMVLASRWTPSRPARKTVCASCQ